MTNRASPVCNQVPRDSCKTSGPIPRPRRPDQTAKQPRNRPDKHPSTAPRSAIQCHFLLVRLGQDTGAARPAGRLIKRQAAQTSTPARFVPPRRIDDGTHSGPHTPAGNPLRAKRPVRARRPAALRQRVLNSDLQRRPPPGGVAGCGDCLELVAEDLKNHDWYRSGCLLPGSRRF